MKKIICLISVTFVFLTIFCFSVFAFDAGFSSVLTPKYAFLTGNNLPDYDIEVETGKRQILILSSRGNVPFYATGIDIYFDYVGETIKAGDLLQGDVTLTLNTGTYDYISKLPYVYFFANINGEGMKEFGNASIAKNSLNPYGDSYTISFSFNHTFEVDISTFELALFVDYQGQSNASEKVTVVFEQNINNFYMGALDSPNAPQYSNPNSTVGKETNELKNQEDKLMQDTEQGREETLSLFQNFGNYLAEFAIPLLAIKGLFDYLVGGTLFEGVLLISLTLGLLSFVFNIFPSIQARQNREKQAEAQRTKNAQYNAMMNKLNKGGG